MKVRATAILVAAAVVFLLSFLLGDATWVGFLRAGAEAGMVGGLADWFAVTALFRRPLGLPIPHTALIPTRKADLANSLGSFVTTKFLTADSVLERLRAAALFDRAGQRLVDTDLADKLAHEALRLASSIAGALDADILVDLGLDVLRRDAGARSYAPIAGRLLAASADLRTHDVLELALPYAHRSIQEHRQVIRRELKEVLDKRFLTWLFASDKRIDGWIDEALRLIKEMEEDRDHELRRSLDDFLRWLSDDLEQNADLQARVDEYVARILNNDDIRDTLTDIVEGGLDSLRIGLQEVDGLFARKISHQLQTIGRRAAADPDFRILWESRMEQAAVWLVETHGVELARLIEQVVDRWSPEETSRSIELFAGRDLQFIRINGTVVGALAGILIHVVVLLLQ